MESLRFITAAVFALGLTGLVQTQTPAPATPPTQDQSRATTTAPSERIIVTGCVQSEIDYRQAHDLGRGGAAGAGVGDEFVLIDVTGSNPVTNPQPPSAVGTSGSTMSYELSGPQEARFATYTGQRVEVTGMLKAQQVDSKLRELEVLSFRGVDGDCPRP